MVAAIGSAAVEEQQRLKGVSLPVDCSIDEVFVWATALSLEQRVFNNWVSNAIEFSRRQGGVLISLKVPNGLIAVEIKDDGIGVPPELIDVLFLE